MKRWMTLCLTLLTLASVIGCGAAPSVPEGDTLAVYYAADPETVQGGDILASVQVDWSQQAEKTTQEQAQAAMEQLLGNCRTAGFSSPVPAGTQLLSCNVNGNTAVVDLSGAYGQLSGMELTIADYCVTLTLTQIGGISMVRILVNGRELAYRNSNTFFASDALLTSTEDVVRTFAARLYFRGADGELVGEDRVLTLYEGETRAAVVVNTLLAGPQSPELTPLLPEDFAVLSMRTEEGVCYLNLPGTNEELLPEAEEEQAMLVQSIVRSLCSIRGIDRVQILLDGELRGAFGTVDISQPLDGTAA
ncbi:MAG: hypothetical protein E7426_07680 [Ruminococcaceae bacterium]|jgi:germination protein M|nr:hypothetical protein [Oscillospiraceae bacterium]